MKLVQILAAFLLASFSATLSAGTPTCHSSSGGYCQYNGLVDRIYVNSGNLILLYFDTAMDSSVANIAGYSISNGGAAVINIDDNPEFANLFYSTALAAQATGRSVSIQMRGTQSGFMKADRIWLSAP